MNIRFSPGDESRRDLRGGFTLLELVVVLMVIVAIISLTWPQLMRFTREQQLREWSSQVRADLAGARIKAIENGLVYQFRYEPGGRWFAVLPHDRPDAGNTTADSAAGKTMLEAARSGGAPATLAQLPEDLNFRFLDGQRTEELSPEWMKLLPTSEALGRVSWSTPILFHLDGTCDSATVVLENRQQHSQTLTLRGLTGGITTGAVVKEAGR